MRGVSSLDLEGDLDLPCPGSVGVEGCDHEPCPGSEGVAGCHQPAQLCQLSQPRSGSHLCSIFVV